MLMLNLSQLKRFDQPLNRVLSFGKYLFSAHKVKEMRADYLLIVEDKKGQLQYMRQIMTEQGKQGIVLKIQQPYHAYIAMYEPISTGTTPKQLNIKKKNIFWQSSVEPIAKQIIKNGKPTLYNINGTKTFQKSKPNQQLKAKDKRLHSLSPILELCHDLKYGDMVQFSGCLGSRKTTTALQIAELFAAKKKHTSIFLNSASISESKKAVETSGCWSIEAGGQKQQTDVGVYMLTAKAIRLAELLQQAGRDVLFTVDGVRHILQAEWHMMKILSNPLNKIRGQLSFRQPRLPPIALLNQIYASTTDGAHSKKGGSLTAILTTENKTNDELMPEVTPYSNNLKHLDSLTKTINFPLTFKHSNISKINPHIQEENVLSMQECKLQLRAKINEYLLQKKQTELKRQLYQSDMRDAPWDYYKMLDAEWWMKALQTCKINHNQELQQLFSWIWLNLHLQIESHWKIGCIQSLAKYKEFLRQEKTKFSQNSLIEFTEQAKLDGLFSPFKKDYLN